ncbi:MAG: amidohydrolase family protein, partial [Dehalococcoidia bacterium]
QEAGFQVALHAVEEEEVEAAISALEHASQKSTHPHRRHRIEHCSLCPPPLLERLRSLEALVVTQPSFLYYSGERYMTQVPREKHPWLYPLKSLLSGGVGLAASSDCPVVPPGPLMGIYAAITRRSEAGDALQPSEAVQPIDVLRMYTGAGAYASFEEDLKGSISVGKLADLVVLDNDPLAVFPEEIKSIKIEMTIAGGEIAWDRTS